MPAALIRRQWHDSVGAAGFMRTLGLLFTAKYFFTPKLYIVLSAAACGHLPAIADLLFLNEFCRHF